MGDGEVAVEVVLASNKFDKQYAKLKAKLKNEKIDLDVKYGKTDIIIKDLIKQEKELENLKNKQKEVNKEYKEFFKQFDALDSKRKSGGSFTGAEAMKLDAMYNSKDTVVAEQEQINNAVQKQTAIVEQLKAKHSEALATIEKQEIKIKQTKQQIDDVKEAEAEYVHKIHQEAEAREEANNKAKIEEINQGLKNATNSTEGLLKKVAKWGLAVFGVRSAYMFIRQAINSLSQYDEKIGADIQYIRFALANELKPIIEAIISLVYKLLAYIAYIAKAWFGVTLFANSSAKAFQKVNAGVKDTTKSAKQLQKTLAGFDEMNILQDNGSTSTGGGGGGVPTPSFDLSSLGDVEIPSWVQWIANNGETLAGIIAGIGLAFATWKITQLVFGLSGMETSLPVIFSALKDMGGLQIFGLVSGVAIAVVGVYETIKNLITWIQDPSWENFQGVLSGLETVLIGVGTAMIAINASNPVGWIVLAIGALPKLIEWFASLNETEDEHIKKTLTIKEAEENLTKTRNALNSATQNYKNAVEQADKAQKELDDIEKKNKISGEDLYNQVITNTLAYQNMTPAQKEVYEAYLNNLEAQGNLKTATEKLTEATLNEKQSQEDLSVSTYKYTRQFTDYIDTLIEGYENGQISAKDMTDKIMSAMSEMDKETRQQFAKDLPQSIRDGFKKVKDEEFPNFKDATRVFSNGVEISLMEIATAGDNIFQKLSSATKKVATEMGKEFDTTLPNSVQKSVTKLQSLTNLLNKLPFGKKLSMNINTNISGSGNAKGAIYYPPKLAVGGIINQPGRGVPLAMGGERGAEGVIPLTDSQQMQKLGEAIGKYITVNANIVNTMNGRVISRELKQIENDENFAFNGG